MRRTESAAPPETRSDEGPDFSTTLHAAHAAAREASAARPSNGTAPSGHHRIRERDGDAEAPRGGSDRAYVVLPSETVTTLPHDATAPATKSGTIADAAAPASEAAVDAAAGSGTTAAIATAAATALAAGVAAGAKGAPLAPAGVEVPTIAVEGDVHHAASAPIPIASVPAAPTASVAGRPAVASIGDDAAEDQATDTTAAAPGRSPVTRADASTTDAAATRAAYGPVEVPPAFDPTERDDAASGDTAVANAATAVTAEDRHAKAAPAPSAWSASARTTPPATALRAAHSAQTKDTTETGANDDTAPSATTAAAGESSVTPSKSQATSDADDDTTPSVKTDTPGKTAAEPQRAPESDATAAAPASLRARETVKGDVSSPDATRDTTRVTAESPPAPTNTTAQSSQGVAITRHDAVGTPHHRLHAATLDTAAGVRDVAGGAGAAAGGSTGGKTSTDAGLGDAPGGSAGKGGAGIGKAAATVASGHPAEAATARTEIAVTTTEARSGDAAAPAQGNDATPVSATTTTPAERPHGPSSAGSTDVVAPWAERVAESIRLATVRGGGEMRIRLEPAGLGHIDVRISLAHDGVRAAIIAEHDGTRTLLQNEQHLLHAALERSELRLAGFSVDLGFGASTNAFGDAEGGRAAFARGFAGAAEPDATPMVVTNDAPAETGRLSVRV